MFHNTKTLSNHINSSLSATQNHIQACMQAIKQKNKEAFKSHVNALKNEVNNLASYLDPLLRQIKAKAN